MKKRNFLITIFLAVTFFVTIAYSTLAFNNTVNKELENSVRSTLVDLANQQQLSLNRQLDNMLYNISSIAETLPIIGIDEAALLEYVDNKKRELNYETVLMIDKEGLAFTSTNEIVDVSQSDYFKAAILGENFATDIHLSDYVDKNVFTVAVPIYVDGKIDGVLAVEYCENYMTSLLTTFTDQRGLNLLLNERAEILLNTSSFEITFDAFKNAEFDNGVTFDSIVEDFANHESGSISYTLNGVKKLGEYRPININGWILFFEISEESLVDSVQEISNGMITISVLIIIFAFIVILYILISRSIASKALEKVAFYDDLTGLPNLVKFKRIVQTTLQNAPDKSYCMVKMDLVNFKAINEMFGFEEGDKVICAIAQTGENVEDTGFIQARVSNEEFMFFSEKHLFEKLEESSKGFEKKFKELLPHLSEHNFTFRYGRYFLKQGETDVNDIVNKTNIAHSLAKRDSSNNIWNYDEKFTQKVLRDTEIANKMHKALRNREFKVYLQPKYDVKSTEIVGAEALVRWIDESGKLLNPNEFIPLFEQNGFIVELDKYMLENVCEILKSWKETGKKCVPISVNFSRIHMRNKNFIQTLYNIVSSYDIQTKYIEIELTESTVMENEKELRVLLRELHDKGFLVSIDDFGSGYSSLGMLKNFKVDTLKLDRSFFVEIENDNDQERANLVVESIVELAGNLGMYTVAEGIEEEYQQEFLRRINCNAAQGYYYAKPMPVADFEKL